MADNDKTKLLESPAEDETDEDILCRDKLNNKTDSKFHDNFGDLFKRKKAANKKLLLLILIIIILLSILTTLIVLIILNTPRSSASTVVVNDNTNQSNWTSSIPTTIPTPPTTPSPLPIHQQIINANISFNTPNIESNSTNSSFASNTMRLVDDFLKPFLKIKPLAKLFGSENVTEDIQVISENINRSLSGFSQQVEDFVDTSINFTEAVVDRVHNWFWNVKTILDVAENFLQNIGKMI